MKPLTPSLSRPLSRRCALLGALLLSGGTALVACTAGSGRRAADSALGGTPASGAAPSEPVQFRSAAWGVGWNLEAGPAVVRRDLTVVRLSFSPVSKKDAAISTTFSSSDKLRPIGGIQMLSLASRQLFPEIGGSDDAASRPVSPGGSVELYPVFGAVGEGTTTVEVFLPHFGVVTGIPVVDASRAGFDLDEALAGADPDMSRAGPHDIRTISAAADGSSNTERDAASTTVSVSGDVTFTSDSADLSAEADAVLASVIAQIAPYRSGGALAITGHTDDVADDAHNQTLSEQRAQAVRKRLGELADLSAWQVTASGKGESEPRVTNDSDEHRQANRRVEVLVTPSDPTEGIGGAPAPTASGATTGPGAAAGGMPEAEGPVGTGAEGVDITVKEGTIHATMERATRVGEFLVGELLLRTSADVSTDVHAFGLPRALQDIRWGGAVNRVCNLTLLDGGTRYLEADYASDSDTFWPLADTYTITLTGGDEPTRLPAVWPDTGRDTVVLDLPGGKAGLVPLMTDDALRLRLTDIPVVDA